MALAAKVRWFTPAATGLILIALSAATQYAAHQFRYAEALGPVWGQFGSMRLYAPWAILQWLGRYGGAYQSEFDRAAALGLAMFLAPLMLSLALTRRFVARPKAFGVGAWGGLAEARRAGLVNGEAAPGRVLGRLKGKLLTFRGVEHCIVVGASRSGKGAGHVVPTLLTWDQSLFAYDRKGELWHITADHRRAFSHTFYFSPTDPNTARWNPLFEVRKGGMEIADIQNIVGILVDPLGGRQGQLDFFDQSAANFFTGVILHVLYTAADQDKNLTFVRQLLIDIEPTLDAMLGTLHRHRPDRAAPDGLARDEFGELIAEVHPEVWLGATAFRAMESRVRSSVLATAQKSLALWADPLVAHATSWSDFCIGDLACADAPVSFYLITPQAHADRLAFLVRVMLRQSLGSLMETIDTDGRGRRKRHRVLMMLDEFPKLGALPFLENALGEMAGYGLSAHLICQSFNDVFRHYGPHTSIFDNCHITAAFACSEPGGIERIVKRAGKALEMRESFSDPRLAFGRGTRSRTQAESERYVLAEQDVRGLDANRQFLFVNNAKPFLAEKVRFADLMSLRDLSGLFVSPDGRSAATLLNVPNVVADSYQIAWFIVSTSQPGAAINVGDAGDPQLFDNSVSLDGTPVRHFNLPAKWSPDSRFIAYLRAMDGRVQVWRSAREGGVTTQLTHSSADVSDFAWTADGQGLLYATDASREALKAAERQEAREGFLVGPGTRWSYEHNRPFRRPYALTDGEPKIWRLDLETGVDRPADDAERQAFSRLTDAARSQSEDIPAPKGGWVAQLRPVDPDQQYNRPPRSLSLLRPGSSPLSCGALCQGDFPPGLDGRASVWWRADGGAVYFRRQNGLNEAGFSILEWRLGRTKPRTVMSSRDTISSCTLLEKRLLCLRQTPSTPRMVVSYDLRTGAATTLFDPNPQWSAVRLGETSWLDWTDEEGHRTYGLLVKPLNYVKGRRYPLVLIGYNPADALRGDIAGRYPAHVLAAQGMAAIVYNMWGPEAGFHGPDFVAQNYRTASQGVAFRQLEAVIDRLAKDGLVDPQRVGVGGFSNGLNPAAYGLIHSDRFRTASLGWLRWNPTSYYANRDPFSVLLERDDLVTPMDKTPSPLIQNLSLAFNASRVRAPILVNTSDSEFLRLSQMEPLRRFADAGKPLEMHVFPDETHAFYHPAHRDAENRRNLQWFQFWLQGVEAEDPLDPEQYVRWRSYRPASLISNLAAGSPEANAVAPRWTAH